ncbi:MAG: hypothetical protein NT031_06915 [Planctomycetota bacterium]|nr:hypothetical protein [Planctomycetota bacterium]
MMRTGMAIVALTISAGMLCAASESQPQREPDIRLSAIVEKLDLSAEQKAQVAAVTGAAQADADKERTPDGKFLIWTRAVAKVKADVLTDVQRKKLEDTPAAVKPGQGLMSMAERLGLSDEQRVKVKALIAAAEVSVQKASVPADRHKIWMDAFEDIQKNVLTPEQRSRLSAQPMAARPGAGLASMLMTVGLSKDQEQKIGAMISEAEAKGANAKTSDEKHLIWLTALEDIKKSVLTEEQRKKLEGGSGMPPGHGGGMGGMPPGHGGGMGGGMGGGGDGTEPVMEMLESVGLTPDQKAKSKAILEAATARATTMPAGEKDTHAVWKSALDEIRRTVLTDEQRQKLPSGMGPVRVSVRLLMELEQLSITDAQRAKAKALLEAAEAQAEKASSPEAARAEVSLPAPGEIRGSRGVRWKETGIRGFFD